MRAKELNIQIKAVLDPILSLAGFRQEGSFFVRESGDTQLVLIRYGGSSFSSLCQFTRFMLCFRHRFLRDLEEQIPLSHPLNGHAYPFKIRPSDLGRIRVSRWKYRFELNPQSYDEVEYGSMDDAGPMLHKMGTLIATKGVEWADSLTIEKATRLLERSDGDAWCERLWLEDYRNRANRNLLRQHSEQQSK